MNKKILTVFLSERNKYYGKNIKITSDNKCNNCIIPESAISGGILSFYSIEKMLSNIDSCYVLFIDDDTQLCSAHFHEIISQLYECGTGKEYYFFQEFHLDKDKWNS